MGARDMSDQPQQRSALRPGIEVLGRDRAGLTDLYHQVLTMPVGVLLLLLAAAYLTINALFGVLYLVAPGSISHARPGSFLDAFFFSVQTLSTVGFGDKAPQGLYADSIVTLEAFVGVINIAVTTGLVFARVSKPTARVLFSQVAIVTQFNGAPTLMFRAANKRGNQVLEAQVMVNVARQVVSPEGHVMRAFYDLPVLRSRSPLFILSWTIMHRLDDSSPLYGATAESLKAEGAEIIVVISGVDETFAQRIHARHAYSAEQILWDKQFVDILSVTEDGHRAIDYRKFHDVRDVEFDAVSNSDAAAD
jgi:inward rectifier potassium channel